MATDHAVSWTLGRLSERDEDIVRLRFGVVDGKAWTLDEAGEKYCVIRQLEAKALAKLRRLDGAH